MVGSGSRFVSSLARREQEEHENAEHLTPWAVGLVFALTVAERRDYQGFDDGEVEHGWAGAVEIDNERPSTGLATDAGFRKWVVLGVVTSGLLTAALVVVSTPPNLAAAGDPTPAPVAAPSHVEPQMPSEPAPMNVVEPTAVEPAASLAVAPRPRPKSPPPPPPRVERPRPNDATLANGSSAAVQQEPRTPTPAAKPTPAPVEPKPAQTPAAPAQPIEDLPPDISPESSSDLPDVEGWDEADEVAREQATTPS
jgi:hypothetical protein